MAALAEGEKYGEEAYPSPIMGVLGVTPGKLLKI